MKRLMLAIVAIPILVAASAQLAQSFCGFYVAKADAKLFNKASQVVLVRHDDKTVITMANDYQGDPTEFAMVVPVPQVLQREQIHVAEQSLIDHLDAYTAPRLVEYFDENPCMRRDYEARLMSKSAPQSVGIAEEDAAGRRRELGVTIEATYTVGEYDILILSAKQSGGLETWLTENEYRIPDGASKVLASYIKQGMKFFVAKVNLEEQGKLGTSNLRPLQVAFESPKFMLPIRLGTVNADGPQDMIVYTLTTKGRVETSNYRTIKLPSDKEVPLFVKDEFGEFYSAMFDQEVKKTGMTAVFQEYAWDMAWCDPCAADPLSRDQLRELGVFWLNPSPDRSGGQGNIRVRPIQPGAQNVFVTRLHVRYDAEHFPQDLKFQETGDRTNFQGRYVLRHPWLGKNNCPGAEEYRAGLREREERQAQELASLTGWDIAEIRDRMNLAEGPTPGPWWKKIWNN